MTNGHPKAANNQHAGMAAPKPALRSLQISSCAWGPASGYGRTTMSLYGALDDGGINVALLGRPGLVGSGLPLPEPSVEAAVDPQDADAIVHIGDPPTWKIVPGKRNVGFCWWPFSAIPPDWMSALYGVDTLIVPSRWCASGVAPVYEKQRIAVMPLGLDGQTFVPVGRRRGDTLRFLFFDNRADDYKAGADLAVAAFLRAFPPRRDDVRLDIWSTSPCNLVSAPDVRIQMQRHIGSDDDLVRLYHRYDALLASARGAGFGLVPIEAMATGMPVFHSGQGGYDAIADLGILIGGRKTATVATAHPTACCFEPPIDVFADRLRQLDENYDSFQDQAQADAEVVRGRFTWERTARTLIHAL